MRKAISFVFGGLEFLLAKTVLQAKTCSPQRMNRLTNCACELCVQFAALFLENFGDCRSFFRLRSFLTQRFCRLLFPLQHIFISADSDDWLAHLPTEMSVNPFLCFCDRAFSAIGSRYSYSTALLVSNPSRIYLLFVMHCCGDFNLNAAIGKCPHNI